MLTTTRSVEGAESSILRVLRDAEAPVPLAELDDLAPRTVLSDALTRLTRAGLLNVNNGHISLSRTRVRAEATPEPITEPITEPVPPSPLGAAAPSVRDVLTMVIAAIADAPEPPDTETLTDRLPAAVRTQIPSALTLGTATGALGQRRSRGTSTWFVAPPRATRRRGWRTG